MRHKCLKIHSIMLNLLTFHTCSELSDWRRSLMSLALHFGNFGIFHCWQMQTQRLVRFPGYFWHWRNISSLQKKIILLSWLRKCFYNTRKKNRRLKTSFNFTLVKCKVTYKCKVYKVGFVQLFLTQGEWAGWAEHKQSNRAASSHCSSKNASMNSSIKHLKMISFIVNSIEMKLL